VEPSSENQWSSNPHSLLSGFRSSEITVISMPSAATTRAAIRKILYWNHPSPQCSRWCSSVAGSPALRSPAGPPPNLLPHTMIRVEGLAGSAPAASRCPSAGIAPLNHHLQAPAARE